MPDMILYLNPDYPDAFGFILDWLDPKDLRPAAEQIDEHYQHGGWNPKGREAGRIGYNYEEWRYYLRSKVYPEDPWLPSHGMTQFRDEVLVIFRYSYLAIMGTGDDKDRLEVDRID